MKVPTLVMNGTHKIVKRKRMSSEDLAFKNFQHSGLTLTSSQYQLAPFSRLLCLTFLCELDIKGPPIARGWQRPIVSKLAPRVYLGNLRTPQAPRRWRSNKNC